MSKPSDWKNYEDFAAGIDTNRLPLSHALVGRHLSITFGTHALQLHFKALDRVEWASGTGRGNDWCEVIEVAPSTFFVDMTFASRPREALTLVLNTSSRRALSILSAVAPERVEGQPQVSQQFEVGAIEGGSPAGMRPEPTRELIGLRTWQRYSPRHLYEHTYLSSKRYCWQCLIGEQRGHGDVDLASYYKFDEQQYIFTFREFLIPVASVFCFNMKDLRSTGKFLGLTKDGRIQNNRAGAFIEIASTTVYPKDAEPV